MDDQEFVEAPHAIEDTELERIVYGPGDKVPMADAIKYGLVEKTSPRKSKAEPAEDRAKKPKANRKK